jgi:hypothetical protein
MIISVDQLRQFVATDELDQVLEFRIQALESFICKYTNNDFIDRATGEKNYPLDVQMGAINMLKWQLRNDAQNSGDTSKQPVQSETLSRHSVTYAADSTESDIDALTGVPRKLSAFLKPYVRARF